MPQKPKILIVDDDDNVRESLGIWLEEEGFEVLPAADGTKAAEIVKKEEISVGLIDLKLGEEDGIEVCQDLLKIDEMLPIIIITAYPGYETAIEAIKSGIHDYISKAETSESILGKIQTALEARRKVLERKKVDAGSKRNIVLLCHHSLVKVGIENLCRENPEYNILHTYKNFELVKKYDFNLQAALILVCEQCHKGIIEKDGKTAFQTLGTLFPKARTIIINCDATDAQKRDLLLVRVKGFLRKNAPIEEMKKSFDAVLQGEIWADKHLVNAVLSELLDEQEQAEFKVPKTQFNLSPRELEILQAMAAGLSNLEIGKKLFLSEKTVKSHVYRIFKKMDVNARTQAVMKAVKHHMI